MIPREKDVDLNLLKFFVAVLNSSIVHWFLSTHAYRYSRGYVMLDPQYLRKIPVPNPSKISSLLFNKILQLVNERMKRGDESLDSNIDELVLKCYNLGQDEIDILTS
jgi:hypothetical protein